MEEVKELRDHGDPFLLLLIMVMTQVRTCVRACRVQVHCSCVLQQDATGAFREDAYTRRDSNTTSSVNAFQFLF